MYPGSFIKYKDDFRKIHIIDGSSYLNDTRDEVILADKSSKEKLNNFLQNIFLELEEQG
jgi:hypothetical protein